MPLLELFALAALWGASFLFMRVASAPFGPVTLIMLRVSLASLALLPALRRPAARRALRSHWRPLAVVGLSNSAIPFTLFAYSTLHIGAGLDSILNATTPLWAALVLRAGYGGRLGRSQIAGLLLGLLGVAVLVGTQLQMASSAAAAAALGATLCYGFAVNYARRHLAGVPPYAVALGSQAWAAALLFVPGLALWPAQPPGALAWGCAAGLALLCTALAYVLYFRLIAHAGATFAASVTFLIPLFGVLWAALFLGERVTPGMLGGGVVVLIAIGLISRAPRAG